MKKIFKKIPLVIMVVACVACQTFRDIEIPERPDLLVLNGLFSTDSVLQVDISHSNYILKKAYEEDVSVKNARVEIFENEEKVDELQLVDHPDYGGWERSTYRSQSGLIPKADTEYTIKVAAPGYEPASATCYIPKTVAATDFQYEDKEVVVGQDYRGTPASFSFQDEKGVENYYRIEVYAEIESTYNYGDEQRTEKNNNWLYVAPKVQDEQKVFDNYPFKIGLYINDLSFDGKNHHMDFFIDATSLEHLFWDDNQSDRKTKLVVLLKHISKEHYEYATSADKQEDLLDDPFSEPIPVASNVIGGLGVFAGYSSSTAEVDYIE